MTDTGQHLYITDHSGMYGHVPNLFQDSVMREGLAFLRQESWPSDAPSFGAAVLDRVEQVVETGAGRAEIHGVIGGARIYLHLLGGAISAWVAAATAEEADFGVVEMQRQFPQPEPTLDQVVPITFWVLGAHGPQAHRRKLDVPTWQEIAGNYTALVRDQLEGLCSARPTGGRILLWHGMAGTGKTFALRALAWEWRSWCDFHYVVDPDAMFNKEPAYLVQLLLQESSDEERWRLLVLEDTGELLTPDASRSTGQALSRLLNVTDGLIGQGLRILILITTNEEIGTLHPAVARPGRCASQVRFAAPKRGRGSSLACRA